MNMWVLLSPDSFELNKGRYIIDLPEALKKNEMLVLGDEWLSTTPPIDIYVVADPSKPAHYNEKNGETNFTIKNVLCYCAGNLVTSKEEKKLANFFAMHSFWSETEVLPVVVEEDRLIGIKYRFEPEGEYSTNGFDPLGYVSSMISSMYKAATEDNGKVIGVETSREAKSFSIFIPEDYKCSGTVNLAT